MKGRIILDVIILIIVLAFASVIIFVLNQNRLDNSLDLETRISRVDTKINWLYYIVIVLITLVAFGFTHVSY